MGWRVNSTRTHGTLYQTGVQIPHGMEGEFDAAFAKILWPPAFDYTRCVFCYGLACVSVCHRFWFAEGNKKLSCR